MIAQGETTRAAPVRRKVPLDIPSLEDSVCKLQTLLEKNWFKPDLFLHCFELTSVAQDDLFGEISDDDDEEEASNMSSADHGDIMKEGRSHVA